MLNEKTPLYVTVTDSRYDMFGAPDARNRELANVLQGLGGISDTVEPGVYIFDVQTQGTDVVASLTKVESMS